MNFQIIGHDKLNQLRHVKFFQNLDGVMNQMKKHAEILRPKFEAILQVMDQELSGLGIASWTKPNGGYFISFDAMEGCAKKIVAKAKEAGLTMTGAGATYPYHNDPQDSNIRIAPSFPTPEELEIAGHEKKKRLPIATSKKTDTNFVNIFIIIRKIEINDFVLFFCKFTSSFAIEKEGVTLLQHVECATGGLQRGYFFIFPNIVTTEIPQTFLL